MNHTHALRPKVSVQPMADGTEASRAGASTPARPVPLSAVRQQEVKHAMNSSGRKGRIRKTAIVAALLALAVVFGINQVRPAAAATDGAQRYLVVYAGDYALDGSYALGQGYALCGAYALGDTYALDGAYALAGNYALCPNGAGYALGDNYALARDYALSLISAAGGTVVDDMTKQIGVVVAESANALFAQTMQQYALVDDVGQDFSWKAFQSFEEALQQGAQALSQNEVLQQAGGGGPKGSADPLESLQWSMQQIRAPQAHAQKQAGWRAVDVGILDSGVDGHHVDFTDSGIPGTLSNVDCARGHNSVSFLPSGPGVGNPDPCVDNGFHGTHVAGIVAAQANGVGVVGVAPGVTLVPVKVCDTSGNCYASGVVDGITYAGDSQLDVINMSFFVDDDSFQASTRLKCNDDPTQRSFKKSVARAIHYARAQGVTPVAALGNETDDLSGDPNCDEIPAETPGVVGTVALGPSSAKASYSNWGAGVADVSAPGGAGTTGDCSKTVLSTFPGDTYGCIQGTSMASPHTTGLAALIVSQFGKLGKDGDVKMSPDLVQAYLEDSAVDIGVRGDDACYGNGRIDAVRAVNHDTSSLYQAAGLPCP
jgi:subtilisin family serine protease